MSFYQIEFSKKDNGWVTKRQTKNYDYVRVANSPSHKTIEDAEQWIIKNDKPEYNYDRPWIDHVIDGYNGKLIPLEAWKDCCNGGSFIDYDGFGSAVDKEYNIIRIADSVDFEEEHIKPSDYTRLGGSKIPVDTKYILWFNR